MRIAGWILLVIGLLCAAASFLMPTAVDSSSGVSMFSGTLNLGLLQNQMMVLHVGLTGFLAGAVLIGAGKIAERLGHWPGSESIAEAPPPAVPVEAQEAAPGEIAISEEWEAADGLAIKLILGLIAVVIMVLLFIWFSNHPQPMAISSNSDAVADNLAAEADRLSDEASALTNQTRP